MDYSRHVTGIGAEVVRYPQRSQPGQHDLGIRKTERGASHGSCSNAFIVSILKMSVFVVGVAGSSGVMRDISNFCSQHHGDLETKSHICIPLNSTCSFETPPSSAGMTVHPEVHRSCT